MPEVEVDVSGLKKVGSPITIEPKSAFQLIADNPQAYLIDIRSTMEHLMVGHPVGAIHVPWIDEPDFLPDPNFVRKIRELMLGGLLGELEKNPPLVILICRSGRRSLEAGQTLIDAGIPNVFSVIDGFEGPLGDNHQRISSAGWRFEGLPRQQC